MKNTQSTPTPSKPQPSTESILNCAIEIQKTILHGLKSDSPNITTISPDTTKLLVEATITTISQALKSLPETKPDPRQAA